MLSQLKKSTTAPLLILIIIFTILSFTILSSIISLILFGAMIAYIVRPLALRLKLYVKYETLAILLAMLLLALPLVFLIYFTLDQILLLVADISGSVPLDNTTTSTVNNTLVPDKAQNLGPLNDVATKFVDEIGKLVAQFLIWLAGRAISFLAYLPTLFTDLIILLFSIFYFAKEGDKFVNFLKDLLPRDKYFTVLYRQVNDILKTIMIVNVICAVILGLLSVILYYILGYPYILLLGILTAFAEFVPVVGPWIVYGALGLVDIITGNYIRGVLVIIFGWLIDTVVDMYIRPRLAGKYTEVHPLVFLVGFLFGAITLGLPGLFIGPLIVGITYILYHAYREERLEKIEGSKIKAE